MCAELDKTALAVVKALRASALKAQKITVGFQLSVQLSTGLFFDVGKLEAATKALRLNVAPIASTALPNAKVITKLDNVAYIVPENGASVVKHGSIEIVDNGATALPRVGNNVGGFTLQQIDDYVLLATKQGDKLKVMLGKTDGGGITGYVSRAGNDHTFFKMTDVQWNDALNSVGNNLDEMWKINKKFIDDQKLFGKEFFLSHNPSIADGFYFREIEYLTKPVSQGGLGGSVINQGNNLWKVVW